jgi:hypothetical protein
VPTRKRLWPSAFCLALALALPTGNVSAASDTATATPQAPLPGSTPTLTPVDGGTSYHGRFANPLPTSPDYFPIGVWGSYNHTQANRDLDAAAGLNLYYWVADSSFLPAIRADGRFGVIQVDDPTNVGPETAGWLLGDEFDMSDDPSVRCPATLTSSKAGLPDDGRMRVANWGKGLALPPGDPAGANGNWWAGAAEQNCWTNGVDLDSVDLYWFTDPYQGSSTRYGYLYGESIRNLRHADAADGSMHPHWAVVETGWPFSQTAAQGGRAIQPAEMRSAVWHQMIAGARGLVWFEHSFGGPCAGDHHTIRTNCEGTRPMVISLDQELKTYAPVLNAPNVTSDWSVTGDVSAAVKWSGGHFYVMAGARTGGGSMTWSIPCVGDASAAVPDEGRTLPVTNGSFTDTFADKNSIHIYRIDGGSNCGLTPAGSGPVATPAPVAQPAVVPLNLVLKVTKIRIARNRKTAAVTLRSTAPAARVPVAFATTVGRKAAAKPVRFTLASGKNVTKKVKLTRSATRTLKKRGGRLKVTPAFNVPGLSSFPGVTLAESAKSVKVHRLRARKKHR